MEILQIPPSLIAVEKQIQLGEINKRFDIVVFNKDAMPFMIVECKEMNVPLSPAVMEQAMRYNATLQAQYLILTNGSHTIGFEKKDHQYLEVNSLKGL